MATAASSPVRSPSKALLFSGPRTRALISPSGAHDQRISDRARSIFSASQRCRVALRSSTRPTQHQGNRCGLRDGRVSTGLSSTSAASGCGSRPGSRLYPVGGGPLWALAGYCSAMIIRTRCVLFRISIPCERRGYRRVDGSLAVAAWLNNRDIV